MKSVKHPTVRAWGWLPLAAGLALLGAGPVHADEMRWTTTSYLVKFEKDTGAYQRKGLAMFAGGEVVPMSIEGQILASEGGVQTARLRIVYTFDDGSTLVQEGEGRSERVSPTRAQQSGTGRFVAGTGRYAGISGTTLSKGQAVTPNDHYTEFRAEYTLPAK